MNNKNASPFELKDIDGDIKTLKKYVIFQSGYDLELTKKSDLQKEKFERFRTRMNRGVLEGRTQLQ